MTAIHETAYPRIKSEYSKKELEKSFTPNEVELSFILRKKRLPHARLALLLLLKTAQRLGKIIKLSDIPISIRNHLISYIPNCKFNHQKFTKYDDTGPRSRLVDQVRKYSNIKAFDEGADSLLNEIAQNAAQTKEQLPDIINILIEELVRKRYELPAFSRLVKVSTTQRKIVNDGYFEQLNSILSNSNKQTVNRLLQLNDDETFSDWNRIKREPRKPTNQEIRSYLKHMEWLKTWTSDLPDIDFLPISKLKQFTLEARALDVYSIRRLKPAKKYSLVIILLYSQLFKATDNVITLFIKKVRKLHNTGKDRLFKYQLEQVKMSEKLITQLHDVLSAYQNSENDDERLKNITDSFKEDPEVLLTECDEHLAFAGNNYYPFMLRPYVQARSLLFNSLMLVQLNSTTQDNSITDALNFLIINRNSRKEFLDIVKYQEVYGQLSFNWVPEKWKKLIFSVDSEGKSQINRKYFELCLFTQIADEIVSADLVAQDSSDFNDIEQQLVSDEEYQEQHAEYLEMLELPNNIPDLTKHLKNTLQKTATKLDQSYPTNHSLTITSDGLKLKKPRKKIPHKDIEKIDELIKKKMKRKSILDIIVESEGWLDLHKKFGPLSGFESKIKDQRKRFLTALFCYGCNLGASQTSRSIKGLSRKQIAWVNQRHVTEERLDKAIVDVINLYNKFQLPSYWGTGKSASADGTKWNLYDQNLLSEYHIRYGGYGGVGYYHVSDTYIALFSHFIPCGVYEAIYILDGLTKNESIIQPEALHGDTHAQSNPVFGLSYLLGIELMPRIRNIKDLSFFRPDKSTRYEHIDSLFTHSINWNLIETHMPDMLKIALSIKAGIIAPSAILRRLGSKSRKNKLYFAFRELGRVVRTNYLLKYIGDVELRGVVHAATNKSEEFNNFIQYLFFGNGGVIQENIQHEQSKVIKYNQLVANLVILNNVEAMTQVLNDLKKSGHNITDDILAGLSPYRTSHINLYGDYILRLRKFLRSLNLEYQFSI